MSREIETEAQRSMLSGLAHAARVRKGKTRAAGCFAPSQHRACAMSAAGVTLLRVCFLLTTRAMDPVRLRETPGLGSRLCE